MFLCPNFKKRIFPTLHLAVSALAAVLGITAEKSDAASSPPFIWTQAAGGTGQDEGYGIGVDTQTNVYVSGIFKSRLVLGTNVLTSPKWDLFVAKYDRAGNVLWARQGNSTEEAEGRLTVDFNGNVYVAGWFIDSLFSGTNLLTSTDVNGNYNIFVAKFDPAGNLLWARQGGGDFDDSWTFAGVDAAGNCYVEGYFYGSATFGTNVLTTASGYGLFLAKYDPQGNLLWIRQPGTGTSFNSGGVAVDPSGNCYLTGSYRGNATFGGILLTNANPGGGPTDIFVAKCDSDGNVLWANRAGGDGAGYGTCCIQGYDSGSAIGIDAAGNCFVSGNFTATASFGPYTFTAHPTDGNMTAIFVAKYDSAGNLLWAKKAEGAGLYSNASALAVDSAGDAYVVGRFQETLGFDTPPVTSTGARDVFIAKCDAAGNFVWSRLLGSAGHDYGWSLAVAQPDVLFVTGSFGSAMTFGSQTVTNAGSADLFVTRIGPAVPALSIASETEQVRVSWPASDLNCSLETSSNLVDWLGSGTTPALVSNRMEFIDAPTNGSHYYRLRWP